MLKHVDWTETRPMGDVDYLGSPEPGQEFAERLTMPLGNLAYAVDAHLNDNCQRLDLDTRILLANLRDQLRRLHGEGMRIARKSG